MRLAAFSLCVCFAARAQAPASDPQTLQTLLVEVHQLRMALERSTHIAPRIQIAVERLKLQQELVARITRQLDDLGRELDHRRAEQPRIQQSLEQQSAAAAEAADPQKRKDLEAGVSLAKLNAEQTERDVQQLQAREGELASQLQSAQARLVELNDRLDQLERSLNALAN
jgi:chromosome segregation ATPase